MGGAWMVAALHTLPHVWLFAWDLLPASLLVVWGVSLIRASNRMRESEPAPTAAELAAESAVGKRFAWIFGGEGVAIFIAVNVLANIGKSAFLLPTIGVIVGLHFLPLARLFRYSLYYWSGAIQVVFCLGTAVAMRSHLNTLNTVVGLEMGLTLWITVFARLIRSRQFQRRASH
jgi:hypothetical protein